jgi:hypothetical protein
MDNPELSASPSLCIHKSTTPLVAGPKTHDGLEATDESGQDSQVLKAVIEDHILAKLDGDFLEYFAGVQTRLGASKQRAVQDPPIEHVRADPLAYQSPCALDASGYPGVGDFHYPSQDGVDISVRVYHPDPSRHGTGPYPVHLNFHGKLFPIPKFSR